MESFNIVSYLVVASDSFMAFLHQLGFGKGAHPLLTLLGIPSHLSTGRCTAPSYNANQLEYQLLLLEDDRTSTADLQHCVVQSFSSLVCDRRRSFRPALHLSPCRRR